MIAHYISNDKHSGRKGLHIAVLLISMIFISGLFTGCNKPQDSIQNMSKAPGGEKRVENVLVIGLDGAEWSIIEPLVAEGKLPNIARLMENGASGPLYSEVPTRSPAIWTTIATGKDRSEHGIYDFMTNTHLWPEKEKTGDKSELVTSNMRRSKAIWNMLDDPTRTVATVGWLNTWPAETVNGYMVTSYVAIGSAKQVTIKGAIHKDVPKQTYPESLYNGLSSIIIDIDDVTAEDVKDILAVPAEDDPIWETQRINKKELDQFPDFKIIKEYYKGLRWSYANNMSYTRITKFLLDNYQTNFTAVYLEGIDTIGHRFWIFMKDEDYIRQRLEYCGFDPDLAPVMKKVFGKVLENFYILTDKMVGDLVAAAPEDTVTIIISDHGFQDYPEISSAPNMPFSGQHAIDGVILMSGPAVQPGAVIEDAQVADITPTILHLLGMPVGEDMTGKALTGPLVNTFKTDNAVAKIESYETITANRDEKPIPAPGVDKALQDKLESLGYVGTDTDPFSPEPEKKGN